MRAGLKLCIPALLIALASAHAHAAISTFENYPEGSLGTSFTDPTTGITFYDPFTNNTTPTNFYVDYATQFSGRTFSDIPGSYLTRTGYTPGNNGQLSPDFGFDASLPSPTSFLTMDILYTNTGSATFTIYAYAPDGTAVVNDLTGPFTTPQPTDGSVQKANLQITFHSPIQTFFITNNNTSVGFDNFGTPEPASLALLTLSALPLLLRRRK